MEYLIVKHYTHGQLVTLVNDFLKAGWSLQGGVSIAIAPGGDERYVQAIVREVK